MRGLGFRVQGLRGRVEWLRALGFRGFGVWEVGFRVKGFRVSGLGLSGLWESFLRSRSSAVGFLRLRP